MKRLVLGSVSVAIAAFLVTGHPAAAQGGPNCSPPFLIDVTFGGGARWEMCWEHRANEGIMLYDVFFTSPGTTRRPVLAQAGLAQIHVPYDDDGARFHDLSDYGMGGNNLNDLTPAECPGGALLQYNGKDALCQMMEAHSYYYKYYGTQAQAGELVLFSVSHIGQYNYVPRWRFGEDGHIEVEIGATGRLQRYGSNASYGWPVRSGNNPIAISHMHNLYWRLDFDVGDKQNDLVEEFEFLPTPDTEHRTIVVTGLTTEAARQVSPTTMRMWRVRDTVIVNTDNRAISYQIEPSSSAIYRGPSYEPFTQNDFYATLYKACEKWASHNPTTGGCTGRDDVSDFVDGEDIDGKDVVVWYGVHFHHTPRDEDEPNMPADWHGFHVLPRDWTASSPIVASPTPPNTASATPTQTLTPTQTPTPTSTPSDTPVPLPTPCGRGDANCDGLVDAGDLACVVVMIFNGPEACPVP